MHNFAHKEMSRFISAYETPLGQGFGPALKVPPELPASHIGGPGFVSLLCFQFHPPAKAHIGRQ